MTAAKDPRDERWERRADRAYSDFTDRPVRTGFKWYVWLLAAVIGLAVIGTGVSWISSWGGEAKRITGPGNVREQNTQVIEDWEGMQAAIGNVCSVGAAKSGGDADPTLTENPTVAYEATYRRIRVDYNRRMANLYEAEAVRGLPLPSDLREYPKVAPTLEQAKAAECP